MLSLFLVAIVATQAPTVRGQAVEVLRVVPYDCDLYVVSANDTMNITNTSATCERYPQFNPDQSWVAFVAFPNTLERAYDGAWQGSVGVVAVDGRDYRIIFWEPENGGYYHSPFWVSSSKLIVSIRFEGTYAFDSYELFEREIQMLIVGQSGDWWDEGPKLIDLLNRQFYLLKFDEQEQQNMWHLLTDTGMYPLYCEEMPIQNLRLYDPYNSVERGARIPCYE